MPPTPSLNFIGGTDVPCLLAAGAWTASTAQTLDILTDRALESTAGLKAVLLDASAIDELDTYGAWTIERLSRRCAERGISLTPSSVPMHFRPLLTAIHETSAPSAQPARRRNPLLAGLESIGRAFPGLASDVAAFAEMLGALAAALIRVVLHPRRFRLTSAVHHLDRVGWQAMPIMLMISFLIGAIIAQQGIFHFRKFGADVYVVDLVGILVLREIGVLLIAIMSAGRSGSSYTAELGSMKMREEIDALKVMGLNPVEVLVLPRMIALIVGLPILTFVGDLSAIAGGAMVANIYGNIPFDIFLSRMQEEVSQRHIWVGLAKAPFMALIIGLVACIEGMRVKGSAESLGQQTTASVVKAIFLVIVMDGLFAMFFASLGY